MFVPWGQIVWLSPRGQIFLLRGGGQTFYVGEEGGFVVDVDEGMDVMEASFLISKANILVSDVSKISA